MNQRKETYHYCTGCIYLRNWYSPRETSADTKSVLLEWRGLFCTWRKPCCRSWFESFWGGSLLSACR